MIEWIKKITKENCYTNFGLYYIVWLITCLVFCMIYSFIDFTTIQEIWWVLLFAPLLFCVIFSPSVILACIFFFFLKNKYNRIYLLSVLIPLNNLLYMIIFSHSGFSYIVGFLMLFLILPLSLITILLIPSKYLSAKKDCIFTVVIAEIVGLFMVYFILSVLPNIQIKIELNKYNQTINLLNEYKLKNKKYPYDLSNIKEIKSEYFKYAEYKTINDCDGYVFEISEDDKYYTPTYIYTNDQQYKNNLLKNEQRKFSPIFYSKYGKWIIKKVCD